MKTQFKTFILSCTCAVLGLNLTPQLQTAQAAQINYSVDDAYQAQDVLKNYINAWEDMDIKKLEFMLHNGFVSGAGEKQRNIC